MFHNDYQDLVFLLFVPITFLFHLGSVFVIKYSLLAPIQAQKVETVICWHNFELTSDLKFNCFQSILPYKTFAFCDKNITPVKLQEGKPTLISSLVKLLGLLR